MTSTPEVVLELQAISKRYQQFIAVKDLSFKVHKGQLLALIGPNGAGKSTTFNMIGGQLAPSSGQILYQGQPLKKHNVLHRWQRGIGRTFQVAECFWSMTVAENVRVALLSAAKQLFKPWRKACASLEADCDRLLQWVGLLALRQTPCSQLAYGDIKRLELALALSNRPQLLLMDEPTAGMAEAERHELMQLVRRLVKQEQLAVLFTEHSMDMVFNYADDILVIAEGQLIAQGEPQRIQKDPKVQALYLGQSLRQWQDTEMEHV
ncbi:ABC transporter ATP-binding protein [Brackiella oedipodis]|uniref:ABC transporter ATP-binding protein n=1 Tax=Brackiella oedipodis TaxID=124225 RepID=UPI0006870092|nr:ABC transporter ATP-binding protein [Brackiella oedipodis]